jgi:murein DD-endopeptidase MepM/ murein hydrolase activator NlpD
VTTAVPRFWVALVALLVALANAPAVSAAPGTPDGGARAHVVRSGDTLSGIAKRYGVTIASIIRANGLKDERGRLRLGTRISIPSASDRSPAPTVRRGRPPAGSTRRASAVATPRKAPRMPANLILAIPEFSDPVPLFAWPVEGGVSSNFGRRRMGWHRGIDIVAPSGAPIVAAAPGMVIASGVEDRYGRVVKIAHENGFTSVYAHNSENLVELGQWVAAGQLIGTVGRTGRATAEHVHFEIRHEGMAYNPMYLLPLPSRVVQIDDLDTGEEDDHD